MSYQFDNEFVQCTIEIQPSQPDHVPRIRVRGHVKQMAASTEATVHAAKSIDRMTSYTGSGLPFPCSQIAFENTPNFFRITEPTGVFDLEFSYPNAYYTTDAYQKIEPSVFVTLHWKDPQREQTVVRLPMKDTLPLRTLSYRPNFYQGPKYYFAKRDIIGVRGAEATMRALSDAKAVHDIA